MLHRLLSVIDPRLYSPPVAEADATLSLRYLGTAGFVLNHGQHTVVLDPYISRPGIRECLGPLVPKAELLARVIPHADDVLVGHAHFDHVLDAPILCQQTGARFLGSRAACHVARAAGVPESQLVELSGGETLESGSGVITAIPSLHGRVYFGRVTLPGDILEPPKWPARAWDLRHGQVLNWHVQLGGARVVHIDSADFLSREMMRVGPVDVACLCAIGRAHRPGFVREAVELLQPRYVVACHWDWFMTPYDAAPRLLPGVDLPGFCDEVRAAGSTPLVLPFEGTIRIAPSSR